jgi:glutamate dehydrogenase/leucine dehydrogenase
LEGRYEFLPYPHLFDYSSFKSAPPRFFRKICHASPRILSAMKTFALFCKRAVISYRRKVMTPVDVLSLSDHENVTFVNDRATGLRAIIAVHSTILGPAAGGVRMRPYSELASALTDVLKLSRAMSYKNAMAELPLGGGKSVILGDPATDKTEPLLKAFGRALNRLGGIYYAAEDMGIGPEDMRCVAQTSSFVAGLPEGPAASGDPSPVTARGVFAGIKLAAKRRLGRDYLDGLTVAIQGIGHVWTAPADQGLFSALRWSWVRSCLRPLARRIGSAGPDVVR